MKAYHSSASTGGRDDWRTPERVLEPLRAVWPIGLDPCASSHAAYHLAAVNLSAEHDGLSIPWAPIVRGTGGIAFVNFPYSRSEQWICKVLQEAASGTPMVVLCAARPGAQWYRAGKGGADAVAEIHSRLQFLSGDAPEDQTVYPLSKPRKARKGKRKRKPRKGGESAPFPSALLAYNVSWRRFFAAFSEIATCEVPR